MTAIESLAYLIFSSSHFLMPDSPIFLGFPSMKWVIGFCQVLDEIKELALKRAGLSIDDLAARFRERAAARETKDYARSDQIRQELAALGVALMDGGDGTLWRPAAVVEDQLQTA